MALPLPNLDDRRWLELVDEARTLIPVYAPQWTDHNLHDPGITFLELLAWIAEMDIYQANRIPDRHRFAFLALAGIEPRRPRGASTVASFELGAGAPPTPLPAGIEVAPVQDHRLLFIYWLSFAYCSTAARSAERRSTQMDRRWQRR